MSTLCLLGEALIALAFSFLFVGTFTLWLLFTTGGLPI